MDEQSAAATASANELPGIHWNGPWSWPTALASETGTMLCAALARVLPRRRWFGAKSRTIAEVAIVDWLDFGDSYCTLLVRVRFTAGADELYQIPLAFEPAVDRPSASLAALVRVTTPRGDATGVLTDALASEDFCRRLLSLFDTPRQVLAGEGELAVRPTDEYLRLRGSDSELAPLLAGAEQSNTSVIFGDRLILKIFRRIENGINPDFELSAALTRRGFSHSPPLAGALEYARPGEDAWGLALLQAFVPNRSDAWSFTLGWLDGAAPLHSDTLAIPDPPERLIAASQTELSDAARQAFAGFLPSVERLAQRTGQMHLALAAPTDDAWFRPEPFTAEDRRQFVRQARQHGGETFELLRANLDNLSGDTQTQGRRVAELAEVALARYTDLAEAELSVDKIRIHGDYHLGQVLATGDDFWIIDFEGEPSRSIAERRRKQLALRDVAGMIRSLHYASCSAAVAASGRAKNQALVERWTQSWYGWCSAAFLAAYRRTVEDASFLPQDAQTLARVLEACLLEKAVYELRYELNNRPDWVYLPLAALAQLLGVQPA